MPMNRLTPGRKRPRAQILAERAFATLERFLHVEAVSGIVLLVAAAIALVWANSPLAESYHHLWHVSFSVGLGEFKFDRPLHFWINDALMTVFFLIVGMEIRQEIHDGALNDLRQASLPIEAAVGGMAAPAVTYVTVSRNLLHMEMPCRRSGGHPEADAVGGEARPRTLHRPAVEVGIDGARFEHDGTGRQLHQLALAGIGVPGRYFGAVPEIVWQATGREGAGDRAGGGDMAGDIGKAVGRKEMLRTGDGTAVDVAGFLHFDHRPLGCDLEQACHLGRSRQFARIQQACCHRRRLIAEAGRETRAFRDG